MKLNPIFFWSQTVHAIQPGPSQHSQAGIYTDKRNLQHNRWHSIALLTAYLRSVFILLSTCYDYIIPGPSYSSGRLLCVLSTYRRQHHPIEHLLFGPCQRGIE